MNIALFGYGGVGKAFVRLIAEKKDLLAGKLWLEESSRKNDKKPAQHITGRAFHLEQDTGLEPAAYCLGSSRSTG